MEECDNLLFCDVVMLAGLLFIVLTRPAPLCQYTFAMINSSFTHETILMTTHGKVGEFVSGKEDRKSYVERLGQYFAANDIDNAGKQQSSYFPSDEMHCGTSYSI